MSENVTTWLEGLGLGQYARAFEENAVGLEHLPDLDHAVLQSIGVKAAGHRMTLLRAAASLGGDATENKTPQHTTAEAPPTSGGEAERRQLTVMFCDLVGSVELGERMDVEDYRDLLGQYRRVVVEAIGRYDGFVARHQGDGLMAYFGYPEARENDAERAVRAGVEAVRAIETLDHPYDAELAMRVGIATGEAVVGDVLDTGTSRELAAFGPTPNLAARLQGEAAPNSVLMSQMTHRLVSPLFDSQPIGPLTLKGIGPGVLAFRLQGDSEVRTPSQVASAAQLSPLVGRDLEVRLLLERWQQACDGEGQAVLLSGDPGVGKTRITRAFQSELKNTSLSRILMYCSPFHRNATLYPLRDQMERAMRFEASDDVSTKSMKMHGVLAQLGLEAEGNAAVLRRFLLLPDDGGEAATLTPEQLRHHTLETLTSIVGAMTRQRPVLMVVEDLHWLDPSTETWLGRILEAAGDWRLLLVLTARPEYAVPWTRPPHMTELALNHLSRRDCAQLVQVVAADHGLAASTVDDIVAKADGVPLFVEELTRAVIESRVDESSTSTHVPSSLQDSLTGRLDRLGEAKHVAQISAVIGREFSRALLETVAGQSVGNLDAALATLESSGIVRGRGESPAVTYRFKHALVQEAAYTSLLTSTRRSLHQNLAKAIEASHREDLVAQAGTLAHHYAEGADPTEALPWLDQAATRAEEDYAYEEAIGLYERAAQIAAGMEANEENARASMSLASRLGGARDRVGRYAASLDAYQQALVEAESLGDEKTALRLVTRVGRVRYTMGDVEGALTNFEQALARARDLGDRRRMGVCYQSMADAYFSSGRLPLAIHSLEQALEIAEQDGNEAGTATACTFLANVHARAGDLDEAVRYSERAIEIGERLGDDRRVAWALVMLAQALGFRAEVTRASELIRRSHRLMEKVGDYRGIAWTDAELWVYAPDSLIHDIPALRERLERHIRRARSSGGFQHELASGYAEVGRSLLLLGEFEQAEASCRQALEVADPMGNRLESAAAHRVLAEVHARKTPPDFERAEREFQTTLAQSTETGAKLDVGRAELSGARIARLRGEDALAHERGAAAQQRFLGLKAEAWAHEAEDFLMRKPHESGAR